MWCWWRLGLGECFCGVMVVMVKCSRGDEAVRWKVKCGGGSGEDNGSSDGGGGDGRP